jgi:hypothetical protein
MHNPKMDEYKDRLRAAMDTAGVSVHRLADHLGISYQAVKKVLDGGTRYLIVPNHIRAAELLGVECNWLAGIEPQAVKPGDQLADMDWRAIAHHAADQCAPGPMRDTLTAFCDAVDAKYKELARARALREKLHTE